MSNPHNRPGSGPPLLLDGAVGTELKRRNYPLDPVCWSARANLDSPALVQQIHEDYLRSGADVITTNTMMATKSVLDAAGIADFESVNRASVNIAQTARKRAGSNATLIAGSMSILPPMNQAQRFPRGPEVVDGYRRQASVLKQAGVDVLVVEMLIDSASMQEILPVCCDTGLPVWAGLSALTSTSSSQLMAFRQTNTLVEETHETFDQLVQTVVNYPLAMAGVMHTDPLDMQEALSTLNLAWPGLMMAYGNIGQSQVHDWVFDDSRHTDEYVDAAVNWVRSFGLRAVGGCCGTSPEHIRHIGMALDHSR